MQSQMVVAKARVLARVVQTASLSSRVRAVTLEVPAGYNWLAGQHVAVWPPSEGESGRPRYYSFASPPTAGGTAELCVGDSDDAPDFSPGGQVWLSAAAGQPAVSTVVSSLALIGVGTGVAPLRAVLLEQLARPSAPRISLLVGFRFQEDVLYAREFEALARQGALDYRPVLSQSGPDWPGLRGHVQAFVGDLPRAERYCVCGKLGLVEDVRGMLLGAGVTGEQLFAEGY